MLCAKFGWSWLSGSGVDENVKSQQWHHTTDRFWSEKLSWNLTLRWAKNRREQIMNNHLSIEYWLCIYNIYVQGQFSIYFIYAYCHQWTKKLSSIQRKKFQVLIFETIHITESYLIKFLVNSWNHGKNWQECKFKTTAKMLDRCNIWPFIMIFMD